MTTSPIPTEGRVLAAIDPSDYAASVATLAGWAAARLGAGLELMHAIEREPAPATEPRDLSGNLAMDTTQALLADLASIDEQRGRLAQAHGRALLEQLQAEVATAHGISALLRQRHGGLVDTLLDLEPKVRLFVIGKRGEHADFAKGHLGSNLERVARAVHRPVLVAARAFRPPTRFLIAFDGSATTRRCVELVAASPLLRGLECHLLTVTGDPTAREQDLAWAARTLHDAGFAPQRHVADGAADTVIASHVERLGIDLLVMGAYGHSRIRTMIVGSTTTQLLRTCQVPVLLLR